MLKVRIFRFDPVKDEKPRFDVYEVEREGKLRVLDVLEYICTFVDPSLEFRRYLCRDTMCNTCFAKVNGRSRLTCLEKVPEDAEELVIEPIDNFELIRDLMVNYSVHKSKGA